MKKLLIAVPLVAIIGGAAAPYFIGSKIETAAKQQVELSNQQLEKALAASPQLSNAKVELDSYEKGYLDAKATGKVTFTLNMNLDGAETYTIPFTSDIKHGPYLGDAGFGASSIVTRPDLSGFDFPDAINEDTVILDTVIGFAGDLTSKATVAPIVIEKDGKTMNFAGAVLNNISPNAKNRATFSGDLAVEQLTVSEAGSEDGLIVKPFTMTFDTTGEADLSKGTYTANSSAIEGVITGDGGSFSMKSIDLKGSYAKAKGTDLFSVGGVDMSFNDMVVTSSNLPAPVKFPKLGLASTIEQNDGTDFDIFAKYDLVLDPSLLTILNSPIDVKTADLSFKMTGIPLEAMQEYQALIEEIVKAGEQSAQAAEAMQTKSLGIFQMLVKNASAANLEVHAKATEGDLDADVDVGFKPGLELSETELMGLIGAPEPSRLLALLVGRGDVTLGKGITDKMGVTPMIQMMAADYVTLEGEIFKSKVNITDGQLMVNGKPLPMMGM